MKNHTLIGTGGCAAALLIPETVSELCFIINELRLSRYVIIGNGSSVLVSDRGYNGIIIKTSEIKGIDRFGRYITAYAGETLSDISDRALREGLTGMEWAAADNGTVGAAIVLNAAHFGAEIWDNIYVAEVIDRDGRLITLKRDEINITGGKTDFVQKGYTVSRVILRLERGEKSLMEQQMKEYRLADCVAEKAVGKVFSETKKVPNPSRLIDECGLSGSKSGGAYLSEINSNFIVNDGCAVSGDVYNLINDITFTILKKKDLQLKSNIKLLGKF